MLLLRTLLIACALLPSSRCFAQREDGEASSSFGTCVARVDDLDCDCVADFAVGAPHGVEAFWLPRTKPHVYLYSGRSGSLIRALTSASPDEIGHDVRSAPDIDGDGVGEIVSSRVVFSGFDGREILAPRADLDWGVQICSYLPSTAPPAPIAESKAAEIDRLFWSPSGEQDRRVIEAAFELVRPRMDAAGCLGWPLYSITPTPADSTANGARLSVESVPLAATVTQYAVVLRSANLDSGLVFPGADVAAWIGDIDRDGSADFAFCDSREVQLHSGRTGALLRTIGRLGDSIAGCEDLDDDGIPDVLVGAIAFSSATGKQLARVSLAFEGARPSFIGDVDGDGVSDIAIAIPDAWGNRPAVAVYSGRTQAQLYCVNSPDKN